MIYFIADTHFYHENIIKYCNRPFISSEQMNEYMVKNWNSVVKKDDIVYHLGDFALATKPQIMETVKQLNGIKYLIKGNHDTYNNEFYRRCGFKEVYDKPIIVNEFLILSHEPIPWKISPIFLNIYGHVHDSELYETYKPGYFCACVERHCYQPISLDTIKIIVNGG